MRFLLTVCLALLTVASLARADGVDSARERFADGVRQFSLGNYVVALAEFEESYRQNRATEVLMNIALTQKALGRYADALANLSRYATEMSAQKKKFSRDRQVETQSLIEQVRAKLGTLQIETQRGAEVRLDARNVGTAPIAPLTIDPGPHDVEISTPGFTTETRRVAIDSGKLAIVIVKLSAETPPSVIAQPVSPPTPPAPQLSKETKRTLSPRGKLAVSLGALSVGSFIISGIAGGVAYSTKHSYVQSCNSGACNATQFESGRRAAITSDVFLSIGIATAIATTIVALVRPRGRLLAALSTNKVASGFEW